MIVGVGVDLVRNSRINHALKSYNLAFVKKILTKEELAELKKRGISVQLLAGIFAAKEAIIKSLSTYLGLSLNFQEIIIKKNINSSPIVKIQSKKIKSKLSNINLVISISHEKQSSIAFAIAEIVE